MLRGARYFLMIRLRSFSAAALSRFAVATASKRLTDEEFRRVQPVIVDFLEQGATRRMVTTALAESGRRLSRTQRWQLSPWGERKVKVPFEGGW